MQNGTANIVQKTQKLQGDMTDEEFARLLGVSQPYWSMLKSGERKPGLKFIAGVKRVFGEELGEDIDIFLSSHITVV